MKYNAIGFSICIQFSDHAMVYFFGLIYQRFTWTEVVISGPLCMFCLCSVLVEGVVCT